MKASSRLGWMNALGRRPQPINDASERYWILKVPIGQDKRLVNKSSARISIEGSAERIGVQWQTVTTVEAVPSMTGISAC